MADRGRREDSGRIGPIESIRRRKALVAIGALAVAAGALVVSLLEDPVYEAQASVLLSTSESSQLSPTQAVAFADASEVARATGDELGGVDPASIVERTEITQGDAPDLFTVTVEAAGPLSASQLADAYAQQFVSFVEELPGFRGRAEVIEKAVQPDGPESPRTVRNTLLGALAGLLLGALAVFVWARLDPRVRAAREVDAILDAPLLGAIPRSQSLALDEGLRELPAADAEAFRMARVSIRYLEADREIKSIVLTSAEPGDGKTTVAFGLAAVAATSGERVLLIEADMRQAALEAIVPPPPVGLSSVLGGSAELVEAVSAVEVSTGADASGTVDVLHAGPVTPDPTQLLESEPMIELLDEVEREYDLVLVDTPPARVFADAIPLVGGVDGVVVVARLGRDRREDLLELRERLRQLHARPIGAVANFAAAPDEHYFEYIRAHEAAVAEAGAVPLQPAAPRARPTWPPRRARRPRRAEPVSPTPAVAMPPPDGPVDLNVVSYEELLAFDLSNTQARRLIAYRERAGGFSSVDDIDDVPGFPDQLRAELKQRLRIDS